MRYRTIAAVAALGFLLMGCASPAQVGNMIVAPDQIESLPAGSPYMGNLRIAEVYGGEETSPMWTSEVSNSAFRSALESSLEANGLIQQTNPEPRFDVYATLSKLDQPLLGLDLTVNSSVGYEVVEHDTRETWFDREIPASYTATFSDSPLAVQRLRLANEGSIRTNIETFIEELLNTPSPSE